MGLTTYAQDKVLNAYAQAASLGAPATHYVGLLTATTWAATHAYATGAYVIPTTFGSISGQTGKIFKVTAGGGGNSGGSEPTWPTTAGGTVVDGALTWTEVSLLFQAGTFTAAEISGSGYARTSVTANSTNFPNATAAEPSVVTNGTTITMATPSADWGLAVAYILADAASSGNIWAWGAMTTALDCASGSTPSFAASALSLSMAHGA